jgi:Sugar-transfer associated ATP-grasp
MSVTIYEKEVAFKEYSASAKDFQLAKKFNKSGMQLAKELWQLKLAPGGLLPADYFMYRLYDDITYSAQDKRRFISDNLVDRITYSCSDPQWPVLADDKWICYGLLQAAGFPVPRTLAVIDRTMRSFGREPKIDSPAALKDFLTGLNTYPLFAKANSGLGSFGAFIIIGVDGDQVLLEQSSPVTFTDLFEKRIGARTYLLQSCIDNHPTIKAFSKYLATVRTVNMVKADTVWTPFALLKVPSTTSIADNYWRSGNLLANLDVDTGVIKRVVRGKGVELEELTDHPETGQRLIGLALPHWDKLRDINEACARLYGRLRYHSLDIALTPEGPQVVEINIGGSFVLPQIGSGTGLLSDGVYDFFKSCGCKFRGRLAA